MVKKAIVILLVLVVNCYGATTFRLTPKKTIKAHISNRDFNRIAIEGDRIAQLFFEKKNFLIEIDEANGQIFLKPTKKTSKYPLSFSMTTENGKTQDWLFTFRNIPARTLLLTDIKPEVVCGSDNSTQAAKLINELIDESALGLQKKVRTISVVAGWKLKQLKLVRYNDLLGYVLTLKNTKGVSQEITASDLWQNSVKALSIEKQLLQAGEYTFVWIVTDTRGLK